MDSSEILSNEFLVDNYTINFLPFVPTTDEEFLPADPTVLLEQKAFSKQKPVLLGN